LRPPGSLPGGRFIFITARRLPDKIKHFLVPGKIGRLEILGPGFITGDFQAVEKPRSPRCLVSTEKLATPENAVVRSTRPARSISGHLVRYA